tara:strand:- start:145 stop:402 length:258 start_codon:yes stop_codon:yes gene_type:complete
MSEPEREERGNGLLAASVESAVGRYLTSLEGEGITDLYGLVLAEVEAPLLRCVLEHTGGNQSLAAEVLGLNRGTLRKKMLRYGLL